ncbi:MAG: zinc ribbon domain-containing protein [Burkholderiales bacterium]
MNTLLPAARVVMLAAAVLLPHATAIAQPAATRLSELSIEIWPEFDRPAALVLLRGTIAEGVKLPATVSLRVPATSEGPAAVAYSTTADGSLLNLTHETSASGAYTTIKFEAPSRWFHIEFYEPLATANAARSYTYTWPGDLTVERASVVVQEPAASQGVTTEPALGNLSTGAGGLTYRTGTLGALAPGKPAAITVKYSKTDARPTVDIKGLRTAQNAQAPAPAAPVTPATAATPTGGLPEWVVPMVAFASLALAGVVALVLLWRRKGGEVVAAFCSKCGGALRTGDKFCGKCGAKIKA